VATAAVEAVEVMEAAAMEAAVLEAAAT